MGAWLGAGILADVAVTQNFQTVDRFLEKPGSVSTSNALREIPRDRERFILRRNAAEENNWIFLNWERMELAMGAALFILIVFGERPQKLMIAMCVTLFLIVAAEHFLLTPLITDIGRRVDDLPASDPESREFWVLHGIYSGLDILKILVTAAFAVRLVFKRKANVNHFVREYEAARADFPAESVKRG